MDESQRKRQKMEKSIEITFKNVNDDEIKEQNDTGVFRQTFNLARTTLNITNDHKEKIIRNIYDFFIDKTLCDFTLISSDGQRYQVHRIVFAAFSEHLKQLIASNTGYELDVQVESSNLKQMIDYCYKGTITLTSENAANICQLASQWKIDDLCIACGHILKDDLTANNWVQAYKLTKNICHTEIHDAIKNYFDQNFKEISKQESFKELNSGELSALIARNSLNVSSEEDVFEVVLNWLKKFGEINFKRSETFQTIKEKDGGVGELFGHIRFLLMKIEYFAKKAEQWCSYVHRNDLIINFYKSQVPVLVKLPSRPRVPEPRMAERNTIPKLFICYWETHNNRFFIQVLDAQQSCWKKIPCISLKIFTSTAIVSYDEYKLMIIGGVTLNQPTSEVHSVDLKTMGIEVLPSIKHPRYNHAAVNFDKDIYVTGGKNSRNKLLKTVEKWCHTTKTWQDVTPMLRQRYLHGLVESNGRLYAVGGCDKGAVLNSVECYDPVHDVWIMKSSMIKCRAAPGVAALEDFIYVVGGSETKMNHVLQTNETNTVERYDIENNKWEMIASINSPRKCVLLAVLNSELYTAGGYESSGEANTRVQKYNKEKDEWTVQPSLNSINATVRINPVGLFATTKSIDKWTEI